MVMKNEQENYRKVVFFNNQAINLSPPSSTDGYAVNQLVAESPPLDTNSIYCNLLQCTHFSQTSVCAKKNERLIGFISAYLIPDRLNTLFIWQAVVAKSARGMGLAFKMLNELLQRPACQSIKYIETTITPSNEPSLALFKKFAQESNLKLEINTVFDKDDHFKGHHESEQLLKIGPLV